MPPRWPQHTHRHKNTHAQTWEEYSSNFYSYKCKNLKPLWKSLNNCQHQPTSNTTQNVFYFEKPNPNCTFLLLKSSSVHLEPRKTHEKNPKYKKYVNLVLWFPTSPEKGQNLRVGFAQVYLAILPFPDSPSKLLRCHNKFLLDFDSFTLLEQIRLRLLTLHTKKKIKNPHRQTQFIMGAEYISFQKIK